MTGIALASATSTATFKFTPSNVPTNTFQAGQINLHTHTTYGGPPSALERVQFYLDDDFKLNTNARPKCQKTQIVNKNMAAAMAACGGSLVGKGTAQAGSIPACVLAFNGAPTNGEILLYVRVNTSSPYTISCANPASNTQGTLTIVVNGDLKANPADVPGTTNDADFTDPDNCSAPDRRGCQLDINHIQSSLPFGAGLVSDINFTIGKPTVAGAGNHVSARCHDGNHRWNLVSQFTYLDPAPPPPDQLFQTVNSPPQTCS